MKRSFSSLALAAVLLAASVFAAPASAADATVVAAQAVSTQSANDGTVVAHVRLAGVFYGDRASTNADTNVGEVFTHWAVTPSSPIPAGAEVIRVVRVGDRLKPGKQVGLDGATYNHLYSGPSE